MYQVGIICDLTWRRHRQFQNYYHAIETLYGSVRIVNSVEGLEGLEILFIGDDHFYNHRPVFTADGFVDYCNDHHIEVVVFSSEKIFGSKFPWNENNYYFLRYFKYLHHYAYDVDDCEKLGVPLHRLAMSKYYSNFGNKPEGKLDEVVFIGSTKCEKGSYDDRAAMLQKIFQYIDVTVIESKIHHWEDYMSVLSEYRFILSPLGNANALVTRFYEALLLRAIPIQQVTPKILKYYDIEAKFDDVIYFSDPAELPERIAKCKYQTSHSEIWIEDYFQTILTKEGLL